MSEKITKEGFRSLVESDGPVYAVKFVQENFPKSFTGRGSVIDLSPVEVVQIYEDDPNDELAKWALKRLARTNASFKEWADAAEGRNKHETGAKYSELELRKIVQRKMLLSAKSFTHFLIFVEVTEFRRYPNHYWFNKELAIALNKMVGLVKNYDQWEEIRERAEDEMEVVALKAMCRLAKTTEQLVHVYRSAELGSTPQQAVIKRLAKKLTTFQEWNDLVPGVRSMDENFPLEEFAIQRMAELANDYGQHVRVLGALSFYDLWQKYGNIVDNALKSMVNLTRNDEFHRWETIHSYAGKGSDIENLAFEKMSSFPSRKFSDWHSLVDHYGHYSLESRLGQLALKKMLKLAKDHWDWKEIYELEGLDKKTKVLAASKMVSTSLRVLA